MWAMFCTPETYAVLDASATPDQVISPEYGYYGFQTRLEGLQRARLVMETYDWCLTRFGPARPPGLPQRPFRWMFEGPDLVLIRDPVRAVEFRVRWC